MDCRPSEQPDGRWRCEVCGYTYRKAFIRECAGNADHPVPPRVTLDEMAPADRERTLRTRLVGKLGIIVFGAGTWRSVDSCREISGMIPVSCIPAKCDAIATLARRIATPGVWDAAWGDKPDWADQ